MTKPRKPTAVTVVISSQTNVLNIISKNADNTADVDTYLNGVFKGVQFPNLFGSSAFALDAHWGSNVLHAADKHETLPDWIYDAAKYYLHEAIESEIGVHEELTLDEVVEDLTGFHNTPKIADQRPSMSPNDEFVASIVTAQKQDDLYSWMVENYRGNSAVDRNLGHYMTIPLNLLVRALGVTNAQFEESEWQYQKNQKEKEMKE